MPEQTDSRDPGFHLIIRPYEFRGISIAIERGSIESITYRKPSIGRRKIIRNRILLNIPFHHLKNPVIKSIIDGISRLTGQCQHPEDIDREIA